METGFPEKHTEYGDAETATATETETDSESRRTIVDEIRSVIKNLRRPHGVRSDGFIDAVLRGLGQVVFQNNSLTGLLVLLAISVNSFIYAGAALFGTVVSTYTATLLRIDNRLVRDGLFGFNGALTAIAMVAFSSKDFAHGDLPSALLILYVALAAGFSTILARAFAFVIRNDRVPGLNFPYCVATLLLLGALHGFSSLGAGTVGHALPLSLHPASATQVYASDTWLYGIGTGISQIFLQDNWLTGIVVVAAIAVSSPIAAAAVVAGSAMAATVGSFLGVSEIFIRSGATWLQRGANGTCTWRVLRLAGSGGRYLCGRGSRPDSVRDRWARYRARPGRTACSNATIRYRDLADAARRQGLPSAADNST